MEWFEIDLFIMVVIWVQPCVNNFKMTAYEASKTNAKDRETNGRLRVEMTDPKLLVGCVTPHCTCQEIIDFVLFYLSGQKMCG